MDSPGISKFTTHTFGSGRNKLERHFSPNGTLAPALCGGPLYSARRTRSLRTTLDAPSRQPRREYRTFSSPTPDSTHLSKDEQHIRTSHKPHMPQACVDSHSHLALHGSHSPQAACNKQETSSSRTQYCHDQGPCTHAHGSSQLPALLRPLTRGAARRAAAVAMQARQRTPTAAPSRARSRAQLHQLPPKQSLANHHQ
jgi:hypothetical protein